ncbi:MAG: hypothetical protein ACI4SM_00380 [Candidatus Gastranaerophilaceae bacterium]
MKKKWKWGGNEESLSLMLDHPEFIYPVSEKIKITNEQEILIRAQILQGTPWCAKNIKENTIYFYKEIPLLVNGLYNKSLYSVDGDNKRWDFVTFENSPVYLPSLLD